LSHLQTTWEIWLIHAISCHQNAWCPFGCIVQQFIPWIVPRNLILCSWKRLFKTIKRQLDLSKAHYHQPHISAQTFVTLSHSKDRNSCVSLDAGRAQFWEVGFNTNNQYFLIITLHWMPYYISLPLYQSHSILLMTLSWWTICPVFFCTAVHRMVVQFVWIYQKKKSGFCKKKKNQLIVQIYSKKKINFPC
jgi:hypothetical protein